MELNYIGTKDNSRRLDQQLGIEESRVLELMNVLEEHAYEKLKETGALGEAYTVICNECNTTEELVLCMHMFVFKAARNGKLLAEIESN